jgi:hypothetical protein
VDNHGKAAAFVVGTAITIATAALPAAPERLDGLWLSDGYGLLAEIKAGRLQLFEVTPISCIPSDTLALRAAPPDPRSAPGASSDSEWFRSPGAASGILFNRVAAKPESCGRSTPDDPETAFEIFAWTFGAHHGFLGHRGVDWSRVTREARPRVTAATKPQDLFEILAGMIEPLHDRHTFVEAKDIKRAFQGKRPGTQLLTESERKATIDILETRYLSGRLRSWCDGHLRYARLKQGAGYLRVDAFAGYVPQGDFDAGARTLDAALDDVLSDARAWPALVIDVRINRGGADPYGVQIAGRLTDRPYVAFVKRARNDPQDPDHWTDPQTSTVQVGKGPRFTGKIVELIGPDTVSAGETFTMALMGRQPAVLRVGEDTQGVYSDILVRTLPNGWRFGLPNEVFLTVGGEHFEARGIPPDVRVPVFPQADLAAGTDAALERALEIIARPFNLLDGPRPIPSQRITPFARPPGVASWDELQEDSYEDL